MLMYLVLPIAVILIVTALAPLLPVDWWWVRVGDFPRVQLLIAYLVWLVVLAILHKQPYAKPVAAMLLVSVVIKLYWIFPYLPLAKQQVKQAKLSNPEVRLRIVTANVKQTNEDATLLLGLIAAESPDVVVLCEVNQRWINDLSPLRESFKHPVEHPLENKYGLAMYSNLDLVSAEVRAMVKESIPSIDAVLRLRSGHQVRLFAVHPNPPRPGEDTTKRDAELVLVGREVRNWGSVIVLGDLNDVCWSRTTDLFQEVSGLLDPRKGRGFYPTYNAKSWIWRFPLDHLFHSNDFRVVSLRTLPQIGSDHLPLTVDLSYEPDTEAIQEHRSSMPVTGRMLKMQLNHSKPAEASISASEPAKWIRMGARLGYLAKGVVYVLIAILAARAAWIGGSASGSREVLWTIVEQPVGTLLLAGVAIGLSAYSLWRFMQCFADTEGFGRNFRGLCSRAGYFGSGLVNGGLVFLAVRIITKAAQRRQQPGDAYIRAWTTTLMQQPFGQWLVGVVGIGVIAFGLAQLYKTWTGNLQDEGDISGMSSRRHKRAVWFGRFGALGRGVVFAIIGVWLIVAAKNADPADARGLGGALDTLASQPYGPWLLGATAGGLCAYGLYQFTLAGYTPPAKRSCEKPV